ncbi:MAG: DUF6290 family protein [Tetragenococcus koreensis]|nr:DUF6290 family protein [Tetragenococcus koreensis]
MPTITVRLNEEEQKAFNEYAKLHGIPLSTLFKQTLEEKMADEMDLKRIKEYEADLKDGKSETYNHDEVMKMLGLSDEV